MTSNTNNRRFRIAMAAMLAACPAFAGTLTGSVQTTSGSPVANAQVIINIQPTTPTTQPFSTSVQTGADGTFTASNLPAGTFNVCPQLTSSDLLAPCAWEATWPKVTVAATGTTTMPPIQMKQGILLSVRVDDPSGKRQSSEGSVPGAHLFTGVKSPSGIVIPMVATQNGSGYDHNLLIPYDTDLQFHIYSKYFNVSDNNNNGAAVDKNNGNVTPIHVNNGNKPPSLKYTITGGQ